MSGFGGLINDEQRTKTIAPDNSVTVNDNGVALVPRNSNNTRVTYRIAKGGTFNAGLDEDSVMNLIRANSGATTPGQAVTPIDEAITGRITDNIEQGSPSVVNKLGWQNWLLIAAGAIALVVVAVKRKKKHA